MKDNPTPALPLSGEGVKAKKISKPLSGEGVKAKETSRPLSGEGGKAKDTAKSLTGVGAIVKETTKSLLGVGTDVEKDERIDGNHNPAQPQEEHSKPTPPPDKGGLGGG